MRCRDASIGDGIVVVLLCNAHGMLRLGCRSMGTIRPSSNFFGSELENGVLLGKDKLEFETNAG